MKKNKPSVEIEEIAKRLNLGTPPRLGNYVDAIIEYLDREYERNK